MTLKIRAGWNPENRNGVEIARIAEQTTHSRLLFTAEPELVCIKEKRNTAPYVK